MSHASLFPKLVFGYLRDYAQSWGTLTVLVTDVISAKMLRERRTGIHTNACFCPPIHRMFLFCMRTKTWNLSLVSSHFVSSAWISHIDPFVIRLKFRLQFMLQFRRYWRCSVAVRPLCKTQCSILAIFTKPTMSALAQISCLSAQVLISQESERSCQFAC